MKKKKQRSNTQTKILENNEMLEVTTQKYTGSLEIIMKNHKVINNILEKRSNSVIKNSK